MIPGRDQLTLQAIRDYTERHGYPPDLRTLGKMLSTPPPQIEGQVLDMEIAGLVESDHSACTVRASLG